MPHAADMTMHPLRLSHDTKSTSQEGITASIMVRLLVCGLLAVRLVSHLGFAEAHTSQEAQRANFAEESASQDVRDVADWIVDSHDNGMLPFLIIDKKNAKVFVFDVAGKIRGAAPALLGTAHGDDSAPGIGQRKLASIPADERTTPAGRFVGHLGRNLHGVGILWVDYDAAISLHRVVTSNKKEQRAQRLASPSVDDNRISSGCINVPPKFYEQFIATTFKNTNGIIYVLPENRSFRSTFESYYVGQHMRQSTPSVPLHMHDETSSDIIRLR